MERETETDTEKERQTQRQIQRDRQTRINMVKSNKQIAKFINERCLAQATEAVHIHTYPKKHHTIHRHAQIRTNTCTPTHNCKYFML